MAHGSVGPILGWPLPAGTLGVAVVCLLSCTVALSASPAGETQREIVVTAPRMSDEALTARVTRAVRENPYVLSDHVTVTTENGIVRVGGLVRDLPDLIAILRIARRIAGMSRVVNEIEYMPVDDDGN